MSDEHDASKRRRRSASTEVWKELEHRKSLAQPTVLAAVEADGQREAIGGDPDLIEFSIGL